MSVISSEAKNFRPREEKDADGNERLVLSAVAADIAVGARVA